MTSQRADSRSLGFLLASRRKWWASALSGEFTDGPQRQIIGRKQEWHLILAAKESQVWASLLLLFFRLWLTLRGSNIAKNSLSNSQPPPCRAPMRRSSPWSFESINHQPPLGSDKSRKNQLQDGTFWGWRSTANEICTKWENPIINVFPPNTELEILSQNINLVWSGLKLIFLEHEFGERCNCFLIVREFGALN